MQDIHTYPGGTSIGTFSGVWPRYARFWTHGDVPATDRGEPDVGRDLWRGFLAWLESLATDDPLAFRGLRAVSPMNEPAHLAGLYNGADPVRTDRATFLPPLPAPRAAAYLAELNAGDGDGDARAGTAVAAAGRATVPDGPHLRVLLWLGDAVEAFRRSTLPARGKELHVNVHESLFPADVLPEEAPDTADHGLAAAALRVVGAWWRRATTAEERAAWAVLDVHHYHAWGAQCAGAVEGRPAGRYACADAAAREEVLGRCAGWARVYRATLEGECGPGLRLASAEASAGTHHSVRHACNDATTLERMLEYQVRAAEEADVELYWWSYKMPYGEAPAARRARRFASRRGRPGSPFPSSLCTSRRRRGLPPRLVPEPSALPAGRVAAARRDSLSLRRSRASPWRAEGRVDVGKEVGCTCGFGVRAMHDACL